MNRRESWESQASIKANQWAARTLSFSPEMRFTFFINLVKQGRPKERHIDHWVEDCIDYITYNAQEAMLWSFEGEDIAVYAYSKTYEAVLKGTIPQKGAYKESQLGRQMRESQYTPKVMIGHRRYE